MRSNTGLGGILAKYFPMQAAQMQQTAQMRLAAMQPQMQGMTGGAPVPGFPSPSPAQPMMPMQPLGIAPQMPMPQAAPFGLGALAGGGGFNPAGMMAPQSVSFSDEPPPDAEDEKPAEREKVKKKPWEITVATLGPSDEERAWREQKAELRAAEREYVETVKAYKEEAHRDWVALKSGEITPEEYQARRAGKKEAMLAVGERYTALQEAYEKADDERKAQGKE